MNIIVFGATGGTGRALLQGLAAAGHSTTAFARNPASLQAGAAGAVVHGDVMKQEDVTAAVAGHDVVMVSLGNSQNPFAMMLGAKRTTPADVCATGTKHIIAAMQAAGMSRLIVVTAFGIGDNRERLNLGFKLFYRTVLREHMKDKEVQERLIKASGLDWTLVQPVGLTDGPATGNWLASTEGVIRRQQMCRADVAAFMVSLVGTTDNRRATVALSG